MTAPLDLPALSGAMAKATPGPFRYQGETEHGFDEARPKTRYEIYNVSGVFAHLGSVEREADAALIVTLLNSAPGLIAAAKERDALAAALREARETLDRVLEIAESNEDVVDGPDGVSLPNTAMRVANVVRGGTARIDALLSPRAAGGEEGEGECECYHSCMENPRTGCSLSGRWHVHAGEPCPVHPDAPGDH